MQDFNYGFSDCMDITLEVSCCKAPHGSELPRVWTLQVQYSDTEILFSVLERKQRLHAEFPVGSSHWSEGLGGRRESGAGSQRHGTMGQPEGCQYDQSGRVLEAVDAG